MGRLWLQLKLLYYTIRIGRNPLDTKAALAINPCLFRLKYLDKSKEILSAQPKSNSLIKSRLILKRMDLIELKKYPAGSLGYVFSEHMTVNGLDPNFYNFLPVTNDESYIVMRMRQTHDLWHVLTGYSTDVEDELALQAFTYAQTAVPLAILLLGAALFRVGFTNYSGATSIYNAITNAWQRGQKAKPLFAIDWEAHWGTPIEKLRFDYGLIDENPREEGFKDKRNQQADSNPVLQAHL